MNNLSDKYSNFNFFYLYLKEGHPNEVTDLLSIENELENKTDNDKLLDRIHLARFFKNDAEVNQNVFVDNIDDYYSTLFSSWPARIAVIDKGNIIYLTETGPSFYSSNSLSIFLDSINGK